MAEETLPANLILQEDGYYEDLPWYANPETEDEEFITTGWKAVNFSGHAYYSHKQKAAVVVWLSEQGYRDTGDGYHYQRREEEKL